MQRVIRTQKRLFSLSTLCRCKKYWKIVDVDQNNQEVKRCKTHWPTKFPILTCSTDSTFHFLCLALWPPMTSAHLVSRQCSKQKKNAGRRWTSTSEPQLLQIHAILADETSQAFCLGSLTGFETRFRRQTTIEEAPCGRFSRLKSKKMILVFQEMMSEFIYSRFRKRPYQGSVTPVIPVIPCQSDSCKYFIPYPYMAPMAFLEAIRLHTSEVVSPSSLGLKAEWLHSEILAKKSRHVRYQ